MWVVHTFASNHPLGGIDGVALGSVVGEHFGGKVRYLVNDLLMNIKGLAPICVPINKFGGQVRNLPGLINEAFESDCHMIVFPAGLCSRRIDGRVQDIPWGKAFVNKSIATGRKIVPVHFIAENSRRFYRIATWNKRLGIKFNVAMMFLPDELVRPIVPVMPQVDGRLLDLILDEGEFKADYRNLKAAVRKLGTNIPSLVNSYMNISPTMKMFGTAVNDEFSDVEETGILVCFNEMYEEKKERHIAAFLHEQVARIHERFPNIDPGFEQKIRKRWEERRLRPFARFKSRRK